MNQLSILVYLTVAAAELNDRPIIGVISQESHFDKLDPGTYIASSYVKWIEAAGGRVVPLIAGSNQNFTKLFESINGVLLPGGGVSLTDSPYASVGKQMFEMAKAANDAGDYFPIWGTCLGFEFLATVANNDDGHLTRCNSYDYAAQLNFLEEWEESRLFKQVDDEVLDILTSQSVTVNFHRFCLTPENFTKYGMDQFWNSLSVNYDEAGIEFISSFEAKKYPFYGVQFHPEKNNFEWTDKYQNIPHTREAVKSANYFADFFVSEARRNQHRFDSRAEEEAELIYNYSPIYTGKEEVNIAFQQIYLFPHQLP